MSRYVSFGVLIVVILVLSVVFYQVMASFILPLFLATVLVVVFRPVHQWVLGKCKNRRRLACGITTGIISLAVVLPAATVGFLAFGEAREVFKSLMSGGIEHTVKQVRKSLWLEMPATAEYQDAEFAVRGLDTRNTEELEAARRQLNKIVEASNRLEKALGIESPNLEDLESIRESPVTIQQVEIWNEFRKHLDQARELNARLFSLRGNLDTLSEIANPSDDVDNQLTKNGLTKKEQTNESYVSGKSSQETNESEAKDSSDAKDSSVTKGSGESKNERGKEPALPQNPSEDKAASPDASSAGPGQSTPSLSGEVEEDSKEELQNKYDKILAAIPADFDRFRIEFLGGRFYAYLKEMANPTPEEFKKYNQSLVEWIKTNFLSFGGRASQFLFTFMFSGVVMLISVYFFLADGNKMLDTLKFLSPLDDRHEQALIEEFEVVSRAVVVATLVTAAVQGVLAGIGYWFVGVEAVFLLSMITTLMAMVPFIGAGAVCGVTCIYLYLVEEQLGSAVILAVWSAGVVSTVDNFLKPLILHGQSNIHPLLALLSVLGGVSALGPIGILVGPMIVVFLHTVLKILQRELSDLDQPLINPSTKDDEKADTTQSEPGESKAERKKEDAGENEDPEQEQDEIESGSNGKSDDTESES